MRETSDKSVSILKEYIEFLRRYLHIDISESMVEYLGAHLANTLIYFKYFSVKTDYDTFTRIIVNNKIFGESKRIHNIKYIFNPPSDRVVKFGRCNLPKDSVFYATFLPTTAIYEMAPNVGDLITMGVWKKKSDRLLNIYPVFMKQPQLNDVVNSRTLELKHVYNSFKKGLSKNEIHVMDLMTEFISDAFSREVTVDNDLNYIISAFYSNAIFSDLPNKIDGIYFPSVKEDFSFENIVFRPETVHECFDLVEVHDSIVEVVPNPSKKIYFLSGLSRCRDFDRKTGEIHWGENRINQSRETIIKFENSYGLKLK